ncbi:hypothetical protein MPSEU_000256000 [Mayamaea pseudoterrestris]|nr:hypothetical protein MPSEU_000256000 [Mayamaea pseudoterrestris]
MATMVERRVVRYIPLALVMIIIFVETYDFSLASVRRPSGLEVRATSGAASIRNKNELEQLQINGSHAVDASAKRKPLLLRDIVDSEFQSVNAGTDIQFLADFGIVGHPKTGTTTLMRWLRQHEEIAMPMHEVHGLTFGKVAKFATEMYEQLAENKRFIGYKAPNDLSTPKPRELLRKYFPQTKLIVGLRHPVHCFESLYNFNRRNSRNKMPSAETLIGDRMPPHLLYHAHLAALGKTNLTDPLEAALVRPYMPMSAMQLSLIGVASSASVNDPDILELRDPTYVPPRMENQVFLYDVSQPFDSNVERNDQFRRDLGTFLGLSKPLDRLLRRRSSSNLHYEIDICDVRFVELRKELVQLGQAASTWLLNYFLPLPDVTVSSPEHMKELIMSWRNDPCVKN